MGRDAYRAHYQNSVFWHLGKRIVGHLWMFGLFFAIGPEIAFSRLLCETKRLFGVLEAKGVFLLLFFFLWKVSWYICEVVNCNLRE